MTAFDRFDPFERRITEAIDEIAAARRPDYLDDVFRQTARTAQRPRWTFPERWFPVGLITRPSMLAGGVPLRPLLILAIVGLLAAGAIVGSWALNQRPRPPVLRGVFEPAGSLPGPATIALVRPDGQVLVFGGKARAERGMGSFGASPESILLYNAETGTSREIGRTATSVSYPIPLADGRVLVIELEIPAPGAAPGSGGGSSAELLRPDVGQVISLGATVGRHLTGAGVRLADGRVLLVGEAEAELFDPATDTFARTGSMATSMLQPTATLLADGRVLVIGGRQPIAELYDPATGTFSPTRAMSGPHEGFTATLLQNGRVLIAGGWATNGTVVDGVFNPSEPARLATTGEIYDPATGRFSQVGPMVTPRVYHFAVALADGRVLIGGGSNPPAGDALAAELFDPMTGAFTQTGDLRVARLGAGAVRLLDGRVLVIGSVHPDIGIADPRAASSMEVFE